MKVAVRLINPAAEDRFEEIELDDDASEADIDTILDATLLTFQKRIGDTITIERVN